MLPAWAAGARQADGGPAASFAQPPASGLGRPGPLHRDLDPVFSTQLMAHAQWGVMVRSLSTGEVLYERSADTLLVPASSMKVVTLAAAARVLGWDRRFATTLEATGSVANGVLEGDLYVRGGGDPAINDRHGRRAAVFDDWARALHGAGVREVRGNLIGDDDFFEDEELGAGWSWDDLQYEYAARVGALQYNENVVELTALPGPSPGAPALVALGPRSGLTLQSLARTSPADVAETIDFRRLLDKPVLEVHGTVPAASPEALPAGTATRTVLKHVAVVNPTLFFVESLADALASQGITLRGLPLDIDDLPPASKVAAAQRRVLARSESPPLRDIAAVMMKESHNLYAETLLRLAGAAASGKGTVVAGRAMVTAALQDWKLDGAPVVVADGSGLSRYNYASARLLTSILERMYAAPGHRDAFVSTLAVAGRDGTVTTRLRRTRALDNARVKTGSMSGVRSITGIVQTRDGEPLAFCIIANNFAVPGPTVTWIIDLAVEILSNFSRRQ